jgi:NhaP-type Na+/H+ or K+/H+ antiporter
MFCQSCGFEYTQKTNYCKRCGEGLSVTNASDTPKIERPKLAIMFVAVAAFGVVGMIMALTMLDLLLSRGVRGDELIVPFVMTLMFSGVISGFLIWQLARMITAYQKTGRNVVVEKHYIRETPPAQLGAQTNPHQQAVEPPSVVEHTTRQFASKYK